MENKNPPSGVGYGYFLELHNIMLYLNSVFLHKLIKMELLRSHKPVSKNSFLCTLYTFCLIPWLDVQGTSWNLTLSLPLLPLEDRCDTYLPVSPSIQVHHWALAQDDVSPWVTNLETKKKEIRLIIVFDSDLAKNCNLYVNNAPNKSVALVTPVLPSTHKRCW